MFSECLLVIDMQNEFLTNNGKFSNNHIPNDTLLNRVSNEIARFKNYHKPVIFIKSEYHKRPRDISIYKVSSV